MLATVEGSKKLKICCCFLSACNFVKTQWWFLQLESLFLNSLNYASVKAVVLND